MPVRGGSSRDPMEPARVTLEDLTPVRKRLQVEISATDVQAELERAFTVVGRQARLRGFRPGRVPRPVLERTFGEQVRREVLGRLVEESFRQAIETHRLEPVSTQDIDADPLTPGQSLRYSATVDVRPVIEVGNLEGLEVRRPSTTVTDEAVETALGRLRESAAQLRPIVDRAVVEAGDIVSACWSRPAPAPSRWRSSGSWWGSIEARSSRCAFPIRASIRTRVSRERP